MLGPRTLQIVVQCYPGQKVRKSWQKNSIIPEKDFFKKIVKSVSIIFQPNFYCTCLNPFFFFYNVFSEFGLPRRHCWPEGVQFPIRIWQPCSPGVAPQLLSLLSNPALDGTGLWFIWGKLRKDSMWAQRSLEKIVELEFPQWSDERTERHFSLTVNL